MLVWLQKGQKRTRTRDGEDDTGGQTGINFASEEQPASSNVSASANTEGASDSPVASDVNNNPTRQEWPDCWSQDQIMYFCSQNEWLISKDKRLGCKVCSKVNSLAVTRLSNLIFLKSNGPPLEQFSPQSYVMSWLAKGRRSADERECEAPSHSSKNDPKTCWSLF